MKVLYRYALLLLLIACLVPVDSYAQENRIEVAGNKLFLSGANVAWVNFARDIGPGHTSLESFESMFKELNAHGGNTMRLWLHTNGSSTPQWDGYDVIGPGVGAIEDLRAILDIAHYYDVSLMLCLWSFDMLSQNSSQPHIPARARAILTDQSKTELYIQNSLIPMVDSLKGHPAIGSWEIFNEPEGMSEEFGWSAMRPHVPMTDIQRFINLTASAIKDTDPDVLVTNGAWSFYALSDNVSGTHAKNYYSDEELIAQGGKENGTLDFYTVHYYPQHFGPELSPYHNNPAHWGLDKPIVVAEFFMEDAYGHPYQYIYKTLFQRGYAGALSWQWANRNSSGCRDDGSHCYNVDWPRSLVSMLELIELYPEHIYLEYPGVRVSNFSASPDRIEEGTGSLLSWNIRGAETATLNDEPVALIGSLEVYPDSTTTYTLLASDLEGNIVERELTVTVLDPEQVDRALNKPAYASSLENNNFPARFVNDGNPNTRWSSAYNDDEWIYIDLEASHDIIEVRLVWEAAFGIAYDIDISFDGLNWETVHLERNGIGDTDIIQFESPKPARYIRMNGVQRATRFGFSLFAFEVMGLKSEFQPPQIAIVSPSPYTFLDLESPPVTMEAEVLEGTKSAQKVEFFIDNELVHTAEETPYEYTWDVTYGGTYVVSAVVTDENYEITASPLELIVHEEVESIQFEAEDAVLFGDTEIVFENHASGGAFVVIEGDGDGESGITWENIEIKESGHYGMFIRYQLRQGEKKKHLVVNNNTFVDVAFQGEEHQWLTKDITVELVSGSNTISFVDSLGLGWIGVDYIVIRGQNLIVTSSDDHQKSHQFELSQNFPNPFNPVTSIQFQLPEPHHVSLRVYDLLGREVITLINENKELGLHEVHFDASGLSSGIYIYRIQAGEFVENRRMTLIK